MNRCTSHFLRLGLLAALAASSALPAGSQTTPEFKPAVRTFPAAALRGELVVTAPPLITLDGKAERLSPGARIRDANNLLVMSGALVNQKLAVNYLRESAGQVHEVWILNSEEIQQKRPNSKASGFSLGSSTDTPKAP
ncbi:MAG: hypothetical protein ACWA6Y_03800 [Polaromonas sp.]